MAKYSECPYCGSNLEHGEECECEIRFRNLRKRQAEAERMCESEGMWIQEVMEIN